MKKTTLLAAALLLAACGETTDPAEKFRDALPKPEAARVDTLQERGAGHRRRAGGASRRATRRCCSPSTP